MSSDFDPMSPEVNHSSPGKILRDAREELGLTQEEVAKELYMTLTKVRYIESDQFNRLHSDTFIRGYLRAYGQLVKADLDQLLAIYDDQAKRLGLKEEFVPLKKPESPSRKIWQFVAVLLGLLLLMWLVSVWFLDNRKKNDYSEVAVAPATNLTTLDVSDQQNSPAAENAKSDGENEEKAEVDAESGPQAPREKLLVLGKDKLEFYFAEECWLEVSDAKGDVLATDLQLKGSRLVLEGQQPFEIKVGNAPAVTMKLNNEEVKLISPPGTNVLSMKVGHSSGQ
jgi:cytoskeleton protein RodZ